MTLRQQSFLPLSGPDNRIFGNIAITPATFTGAEPTATVALGTGNVTLPLKRVTYDTNVNPDSISTSSTRSKAVVRGHQRRTVDYMAIALSQSDVKTFWTDKGRLLASIADTRYWMGAVGKEEFYGDLMSFLQGGNRVVAAVTPVNPTGSNISKNWNVNSPFTNVTNCQFFEINWQQEAAASLAPFTPTACSIGIASADPSSNGALRAFLVNTVPVIAGGIVSYSTIRIVRSSTATVPSGTYTWPLTLTNATGGTLTVNLSVIVP